MPQGKISKKQLEILEYIKSEILRTVIHRLFVRFVKQ